MTTPERDPSALNGWHPYGTYTTLLVRHDVEGTPVVRLMDLDKFTAFFPDLDSVPSIWVIANDGWPHPGRHRIKDGAVMLSFPSAGGLAFKLDVPPTFTP
jgi:hypothetical protein